MAIKYTGESTRAKRRAFEIIASLGLSLMAGACSQATSTLQQQLAAATPTRAAEPPKPTTAAAPATDGRSELAKATEYWGQAYAKNPSDAQAALNYARNLKAMGEKRQALAVLQQTSMMNATHRGINAEYGRLALEFDQVSLAQKLLEQAEDPTNPDWRTTSARGTALAKQGRYREAATFYEKSLTLSPEQPSTLSNLALAYAMEGEVDKAEPLLKRAAGNGSPDGRINQNLALVLSLQGKYDEAKLTGARDLAPDKAAANVDYLRSIVQLDAKPLATGSLPTPKEQVAKDQPSKAPALAELKAAAADQAPSQSGTNWATVVEATRPKR
jgi:Flp pilus assembly protein TadD